jgi:hypothetical protein
MLVIRAEMIKRVNPVISQISLYGRRNKSRDHIVAYKEDCLKEYHKSRIQYALLDLIRGKAAAFATSTSLFFVIFVDRTKKYFLLLKWVNTVILTDDS